MTSLDWQRLLERAYADSRLRQIRMRIIGLRWDYAGRGGWQYIVVPCAEAAYLRWNRG